MVFVYSHSTRRDGLDVSGWDPCKALGLFAKSNPPLLEWLQSPIVYHQAYSAVPRLQVLIDRYFSPRSCLHHYLGMSEGNYREYLQGNDVHVKKYFYVLRPILACRWIATHGTLQQIVTDLLDRKRAGDELARGPRIPQLNQFLDTEIRWLHTQLTELPQTAMPDWEALDDVFRTVLAEASPGVRIQPT